MTSTIGPCDGVAATVAVHDAARMADRAAQAVVDALISLGATTPAGRETVASAAAWAASASNKLKIAALALEASLRHQNRTNL